MSSIIKTYNLTSVYSEYSSWVGVKPFNGALSGLCSFLNKKLSYLKEDSVLYVVSLKWLFGVSPLDLLVEGLSATILSAEETAFKNGYLLKLGLEDGITVYIFLSYDHPNGSKYLKKVHISSSDVFTLPENGLVNMSPETGLVTNALLFPLAISSQNTSVMEYSDYAVWFLLVVILYLLLFHNNNFYSTLWWGGKNVFGFMKKVYSYIPFGGAILMPLFHNVFGYGSINHWLFDLFMNSIRLLGNLGWYLILFSTISVGVVLAGVVIYKIFTALGCMELYHSVVNWWQGNPPLRFPEIPGHQPGHSSDSSEEETNVLARRLQRLIGAGENNPPVAQALERIQNDIDFIVNQVVEPEEGAPQVKLSNPLFNYSLLGGAAVLIASGLFNQGSSIMS